jgi:hypothetical protein
MLVSIPPSAFHDIAFQPEDEYRKTLALGSGPPLLERLSVAEPVVVPLRPDQVYSDVRVAEFFASNSDRYRFALVRLACAFAPPPDEPITLAVIAVSLEPASGAKVPIVVDMDPDKISDVADIKRNLEGGVDLDVMGNKLGFTAKRSTERPGAELFLVAAGIGRPQVGWEIYDTHSIKIGGILVFNMIVQTKVDQPATGRIAATIQVRRKRFGLIPYRALLDNHPTGQFVCPA